MADPIDVFDFDRVEATIELAVSVATEFRLSTRAAAEIVAYVSGATGQWRSVALTLGASPSDLERMEPAFEHQATAEARALTGTTGRPSA